MHFIKKTFYQLIDRLWSLFLQGLFTILPLTITIVLFHTAFKLIAAWLSPMRKIVPPAFLEMVPYAEIFLIILLIFILGAIVKSLIVQPIIHAIEAFIIRIPLIRPVYAGIKQLVQAFSMQDKITFKYVVVVEFPRKGLYSLGFLTSALPADIAPTTQEKFFNIFIPTTPNPTSGYFIVVPEQEIKRIDLSRQEAMAMIISGGIIQPDRFEKK